MLTPLTTNWLTGHKINIMGLDNHELTGLDVVTAVFLLTTNQDKAIGIFHEYAHLGKGLSIHPPSQMEWYKVSVDDRSVTSNTYRHLEIMPFHSLSRMALHT